MKGSEAQKELRQLGVAIRDLRKANGLSQEDFAEVCDLHRTYIGQIERGEVNVSFKNILRISKALSITPSELLSKSHL